MIRVLDHLSKADQGAAGVEYAMLVAIVAVAIAAFSTSLSTSISSAFNTVLTNW